MKKIFFSMGILLMLMSLSHALIECPAFGFGISNGVCVPDLFINWATVLAFISVGIIAIGYMIAQAVQSPRLVNLMKEELYQVIATLIIVSIYMGGLAFLDVLGPSLYTSNLAYPGESSIRVGNIENWSGINNHAISYLTDLNGYLKDRINSLGKLNVWIGLGSSLVISVIVGSQSFYAPVFSGLGSLNQTLATVIGMYSVSVIQLTMQLELMKLWPGLFGVLLPFGIVLRMFPFTRAAGGVLIAIVFGFTMLLPMMYLVIQDVSAHFYKISGCQRDQPDVGSIAIKAGISVSSLSGDMFGRILGLFGPGGILRCISFRAGIESSLLPFFAYLIALNATKRLAGILGAEVNLGTLVRII